MALLAALGIGYLLDFKRLELHPEQWIGLTALALVGTLDDRFGLKARHKALAGLLVACMIAIPGATRVVELQPDVTLLGMIPLPPVWPLAFLLLVLLYWFVPQAMNLIDGANGLALGYGLVVLGVLALAGRPLGFCAGTLVGLLLLNWPRARHFLGDAGSLVLGLLLALEVKRTVGLANPDLVLWIFAYPILDVVTVVTIRILKGQRLGVGDRSHLHHQWIDRFPRWRQLVVPGLWLQAGLCASAAVVQGWGWILPVLGLSMLVVQVVVFVSQSVSAGREPGVEVVEFQAADEDNGTLSSPRGDFDAA
jgi:UDP-GlcNAc:undecaprenyl-phosphate GlcNAc-1-phosphate transferase